MPLLLLCTITHLAFYFGRCTPLFFFSLLSSSSLYFSLSFSPLFPGGCTRQSGCEERRQEKLAVAVVGPQSEPCSSSHYFTLFVSYSLFQYRWLLLATGSSTVQCNVQFAVCCRDRRMRMRKRAHWGLGGKGRSLERSCQWHRNAYAQSAHTLHTHRPSNPLTRVVGPALQLLLILLAVHCWASLGVINVSV